MIAVRAFQSSPRLVGSRLSFHSRPISLLAEMSSRGGADSEQYSLMETLASRLVQSSKPIKACIAVAGGGSSASSAIASTPGASSLLLESIVAYDRRSQADFVSRHLDEEDDALTSSDGKYRFCSAESAVLLSRAALRRSTSLSPCFRDRCLHCVGVGCASSLVGKLPPDDDEKSKRKSRIFVACSTWREGTFLWEVELSSGENHCGEDDPLPNQLKSRRTRSEEERVASNLMLLAMLRHCNQSGDQSDDQTVESSKLNHDQILNQILNREGDTLREQHLARQNNGPPPTSSPAEGALRIIQGEADVVAVLPVPATPSNKQHRMETLSSDAQIPLPNDVLIVPGSFNPPHHGHVGLANAAKAALGHLRQSEQQQTSSNEDVPILKQRLWNAVHKHETKLYDPTVLFEISVVNADKPPLDPNEVERRLNSFLALPSSEMPRDWGVILTNAPLFSQKAQVLNSIVTPTDAMHPMHNNRKMTFVIGTDTMVRIIHPKYYGNSFENMIEALESMKKQGVHFIVGGRLEQGEHGSKFVGGQDEIESLPSHVRQMFTLLEGFRVDVSSTELRKRMEATVDS